MGIEDLVNLLKCLIRNALTNRKAYVTACEKYTETKADQGKNWICYHFTLLMLDLVDPKIRVPDSLLP